VNPANILDDFPLGVVHADASDRISYVNREFYCITECTPEDLRYMNFQDVLSLFCLGMACEPGPGGRIQCPEDKWLAVEQYIRTSAGAGAWVRIRLSSFAGPQGPMRQLLVEDVSQYKDIIDLLSPGRRLSEPERRPDPVCGFLPNWALTFANQSFLRAVGVDREQLVNQDFLSLMPEESRNECSVAVNGICLERPVAEVECKMFSSKAPDEGEGCAEEEPPARWMRWIIQAAFYKTGHVKDFQAFGMDISEQKKTESRFVHTDRLASLGTMVSGVAHEVNNPNNIIKLNTALLQDLWQRVEPVLRRSCRADQPMGGADQSDLKHLLKEENLAHILNDFPELLQGVLDGAERIKDIVSELKNFGRRDACRDFELLSLNDVTQSAVSLMRRSIEKHTDRFSLELDPSRPMLMGRRRRLEQIVVNLVHNACLALEHRNQAVTVRVHRDETAGSVLMEVRDEGVGIPESVLPRVTDPFYSTRLEQDGAGLGLPISLSIVREHGGSLDITSPPQAPSSEHVPHTSGTLVRAVFPLAG
jgi:signal transduction histidine kinase